MSKFRYFLALFVGIAIMGVGIYFTLNLNDIKRTDWELVIAIYGIGAFVSNLIWFSGPSIAIAKIGISIIVTLFTWFIGLFTSGCGLIILGLFFPVIGTVIAGIAVLSILAMAVVGAVTFPFNIFLMWREVD